MEEKKQKSIIAGALTGSAAILITKILSVLYVIPYNEIALEQTVFYSYGYQIYSTVLDICLSGLPFAIATLMAKYLAKKDPGTVQLVKKVSKTLIILVASVSFIAVLLGADIIVKFILPTGSSQEYITKTTNVLRIISLALFFVPYLAYYRGIYQGRNELGVYSFSQVFEQIIRIVFLLASSAACVFWFKMDRIWAAYMGVASASVSAIVTIIYFLMQERKQPKEELIESQYTNKQIAKEIIEYSIPYLLNSLLSSSGTWLVMLVLPGGLTNYGVSADEIITISGLLNYQVAKLTSIPSVISIGFGVAIIPHLTQAFTNNDKEKCKELLSKAITCASYFTIPICLFMAFNAQEVYYVIFGSYELDLGSIILSYSVVAQILFVISSVIESSMLVLKLRKQYLINEIIRIGLLFVLMDPFISKLGVKGYFIAAAIEIIVYMILNVLQIEKEYDYDYKAIVKKIGVFLLGCAPLLLSFINIDFIRYGRLFTLLICGILGVGFVSFYLFFTNKFGLFEEIFGVKLSLKNIKNIIKK